VSLPPAPLTAEPREASWSAPALWRFCQWSSNPWSPGIRVSLPLIPPSPEPPAHRNHRLTLRLATILLLLGEKAGMRADVTSSRRDWLPPRFMVREQFPSEPATAHEPWLIRSLESSADSATADDSPSPGGEGRGEGGLVAPQQSEGGRILSPFTYFSAFSS
jgi:hypothetical protein